MESTTFLAQIWGPVLLAAGLGFFVRPKYYIKIYRDLEKAPFAVLFFGMVAMAAGLAQILVHNLWGNFIEVLVSLMGWSLLLKGVVCTVLPDWAERMADWVIDVKLVPAAGAGCLVLGAILTWVAYLA